MRRRPGQQLPPHDCSYTVAEYSSVELLRCMFGCVGYVSRRLTAAAQESWGVLRWGCEKWVMDRVIRGRASNVQKTLTEWRAASAARCDFRSSYHTIYKLKKLVKDDKFVRLYFLLVADAEAIDEPQPQQDLTCLDELCLESVTLGRSRICRMMLECNANARLVWKWQPLLHYAVQMGHLEICHLLLHFNADPQTKDRKQWTLLHDAACHGSPDICRLLLQNNVDPRAEGFNQRTALHNAAWYGRLEACRLLVESKADVAVRNSEGRTALRYALDFKRTAVVEYIRSIGAPE